MDVVTLTVVADEAEADILCELLRTNGIECSYRRTDSDPADPDATAGFGIAGPTEVLVDADDLEAARQLVPPPA